MKRLTGRRLAILSLVVILFTLSAAPVLADNGEDARVVVGGSFTLRSGEVLGQDLVILGGNAVLEEDSLVNGDVVLFGGSLVLAGRVNGDMAGVGGRLILRSGSLVNGDLVALCTLERDPGSEVRGNTVHGWNLDWQALGELRDLGDIRSISPSFRLFGGTGGWGGWGYQAFRFVMTTLALMAVGVLIALFLPRQSDRVAQVMMDASAPALGFGLLTLVVTALATPVLIVICIGIPVAIVLWLAESLAGLFGWLTAGLLTGRRIFQAFKADDTPPILEIAAGVAALSLLSAIPCLGTLFSLLVAAWGLGAVILSRAGTMPYPRVEPVPGAPEPLTDEPGHAPAEEAPDLEETDAEGEQAASSTVAESADESESGARSVDPPSDQTSGK